MSAGLLVAIALMISGTGSLAGPVRATEFELNLRPWLELGRRINQFIPITEFVTDLAGPPSIDYGADGRLTTLLVGSDWRERLAGIGERTDTMIVASINPTTHQMSLLSLPRDVGNVPIGPNQVFQAKINGLFKVLKRDGTREEALEGMRQAFEYALQIEIDYVAYARFDGFEALVEEVGGVPTHILKDVYDSGIYDERTTRPPGAKFLIDATEPLPVTARQERTAVRSDGAADQLVQPARVPPGAALRAQPPRTGQLRLGARPSPAGLHPRRDRARHFPGRVRVRIRARRARSYDADRLLHDTANVDRCGHPYSVQPGQGHRSGTGIPRRAQAERLGARR